LSYLQEERSTCGQDVQVVRRSWLLRTEYGPDEILLVGAKGDTGIRAGVGCWRVAIGCISSPFTVLILEVCF
jgi:hypothetical protein